MRLTFIDGGQDWLDVDERTIATWSRAWLAAWNAHEVEDVVALCHREVVIDDPVAPALLCGREGARRLATATFEAYPDFAFAEIEPPRVAAHSHKVVASYRVAGTMLGRHPITGLAPTGASVDFDAIYEWELRGGLLYRQVGWFNVADVARQLGVIPEHGTRAISWLLRSQALVARLQRLRRRRGQAPAPSKS